MSTFQNNLLIILYKVIIHMSCGLVGRSGSVFFPLFSKFIKTSPLVSLSPPSHALTASGYPFPLGVFHTPALSPRPSGLLSLVLGFPTMPLSRVVSTMALFALLALLPFLNGLPLRTCFVGILMICFSFASVTLFPPSPDCASINSVYGMPLK